MFKSLAATALAAVLALTPITAAPAHADSDDIAKVLGGLTLLYIIGKAASDQRDSRHASRPVVQPPRHTAKRIPRKCYREFNLRRGGVAKGYGARCMQNNVARAGTLPPNCITRVRTDRGNRNLYGGRCLSRNGWELARR